MQNKKTLILIPALAVIMAVSGCAKKETPSPTVNNNTNAQQVNANVNENQGAGAVEDVQSGERGEEIEVWPDVSFSEEDYEGWKTYTNTELGYSIKHPADWEINACDEGCSSKEVIINPLDHEPFITYIGMGIDSEYNFDFIKKKKYEYFPDTIEKKIIFCGKESYQFSVPTNNDRIEIKIILNNGIFDITTDRRYNKQVQQALASFQFID